MPGRPQSSDNVAAVAPEKWQVIDSTLGGRNLITLGATCTAVRRTIRHPLIKSFYGG